MSAEPLLASLKDPGRIIMFILMLALLGVDVFTNRATGSEEMSEELKAEKKELELYRQEKRDERLKQEIFAELGDEIKEAISPLMAKLDSIDKDMQRGSRWSLEDEVALHKANGNEGADPIEIQNQRLAKERRELLKRE